MLSTQAFNALLKVIEEPPANVVFILCTTEAHKVPATIISRCQRFDFKRIGVNDAVKKLTYIIQAEKIKIEKDILEAIARHADGHMRDAESLLGQIIAIGGAEITQAEADLVIPRSDLNEVINLLEFLIKKDAAGGIRLINKLMDDGVDLKIFVKDTIEILRKLMLMKISPSLVNKLSLELGETFELKINKLAQDLTVELSLKLLEKFIKVSSEIKADFIQQLSLEMAIAEICTATVAVRSSLGVASSFTGGSRFNAPKSATVAVKTEEEKKIVNTGEPINFTDDQIQEKWNEVLAKVKQYNHSLSFILRVCQPRNLNDNKLCLAFKYKFHKDRVSEIAIKNIIEKVLHQVYGAQIMIEAVIDENLEVAPSKLVSDEPIDLKKTPEPAQGEQGNMIDNLLKTFGGKIVS
jgi:DNA polymerase-3 subunit gamma/tau